MKKISLVVPVYNEEKNVKLIFEKISVFFENLNKDSAKYNFEIIFVNDGSKDNSQKVLEELESMHAEVKLVEFSRNFGKEAATSAGLKYSSGDAAVMIDADLQHPVDLIGEFLKHWESGFDTVIGVRTENKGANFLKKILSKLYYKIINSISGTPIVPGATDFRLIDRIIIDEYNKFTEHDRITRGLLDWLGFRRHYVNFIAEERAHGEASYSYLKLVKLAISSFVSHSLFPLKFAGYLGIFIILTSGLGGFVVFVQRYVYHDILEWHISGTAQLAILMIFFIGIVLSCLGLIALYIGNITAEVSGRPLYVVRKKNLTKI